MFNWFYCIIYFTFCKVFITIFYKKIFPMFSNNKKADVLSRLFWKHIYL
nr:MAG TPA: hypothetical protein [Caudoviricetes sp.]